MNPDNPYAAPQTVEPRLAADESLPVAVLVGRQRYPETDTATLERLKKLSRAIEAASSLWSLLLLNVLGLTMLMLFWVFSVRTFFIYGAALLVFDGVLIYRLYADAKRRTSDRILIALADGLLLAMLLGLCFEGLLSLLRKASWEYVLGMLMMGVPIWILVRSIRATLSARPLFGPKPYLHGELTAEVEYRRANKIG